jgi:transposase
MEWLTDRQAMDAFRSRADWKYALHIPINYHGVPEGALCQYRQENLFIQSRCMEMQDLLGRLAADKVLSRLFEPPLEAERLIISVCTLNRSARVLDAMHAALESLASEHPDWLRQVTSPHWYARYNPAASSLTPLIPRDEPEIIANEVGKDAYYLLERAEETGNPEINHLVEIRKLRAIFLDQFELSANRSVRFLPRCGSCPSSLTMNGYDMLEEKHNYKRGGKLYG